MYSKCHLAYGHRVNSEVHFHYSEENNVYVCKLFFLYQFFFQTPCFLSAPLGITEGCVGVVQYSSDWYFCFASDQRSLCNSFLELALIYVTFSLVIHSFLYFLVEVFLLLLCWTDIILDHFFTNCSPFYGKSTLYPWTFSCYLPVYHSIASLRGALKMFNLRMFWRS